MNNKVLTIWNSLSEDKVVGFVKRLFSTSLCLNLYCTFQYPDNYYGIALSFPKNIHFKLQPFEQLSAIKVAVYQDDSFKKCNLLSVQLMNPLDEDIFAYLCENLIAEIANLTDVQQAVTIFGNTLLRWKNLFERKNSGGLSTEEQQGLYGELNFLHKCLISGLRPKFEILQYYVGVNKSLRDFQGFDWAVEVKTTSTNNPQELTINGERQLDNSMIDKLYLYHCSVEVSNLNGETLVEKINAIKKILDGDVASLSLYNGKLFEAGYWDEDSHLYESRCYRLRSEKIYHVKDAFPRIKEKDLLPGVGNVKYGIVIADCEPYLVSENIVLDNCLGHD